MNEDKYLAELKEKILKEFEKFLEYYEEEFCAECKKECSEVNRKLEKASGFVSFVFFIICDEVRREEKLLVDFVEEAILRFVRNKILKKDIRDVINEILYGEKTDYIL